MIYSDKIAIHINKKKETVMFSTFLQYGDRILSLSVTQHLGYQKAYRLDHSILPLDRNEKPIKDFDLFEDIFYWNKECYLDPAKNHNVHRQMIETDFYYVSEEKYEVQCIEIKVEHTHCIKLSNKKKFYLYAIPPANHKEDRIDYITHDGIYHYNCSKEEFIGIEVFVPKKDKSSLKR